MDQPRSIADVVASALREMGLGTAPTFRTLLFRDGYFVGYAVWSAEEDSLAVYDREGKRVSTAVSEDWESAA